jgi:peptide deformylase
LQIVVSPDPRLLKKAEPIEPNELSQFRSIAAEMTKLMYETLGCGIAAPQVGIARQLIVIDPYWGIIDEETGVETPQNPAVLVNPQIKRLWGDKEAMDEGCLSVPGIAVPIERYQFIEVLFYDLDGNQHTLIAEDFPARVLQHEIDHLNGMTLFERLDAISRIDALRNYEDALAAGARPGDTSIPLAEDREIISKNG